MGMAMFVARYLEDIEGGKERFIIIANYFNYVTSKKKGVTSIENEGGCCR